MKGGYQVAQIGVDTDVVIKGSFQVQNVVLICLLVDVLNRHIRIEEVIELR